MSSVPVSNLVSLEKGVPLVRASVAGSKILAEVVDSWVIFLLSLEMGMPPGCRLRSGPVGWFLSVPFVGEGGSKRQTN